MLLRCFGRLFFTLPSQQEEKVELTEAEAHKIIFSVGGLSIKPQ